MGFIVGVALLITWGFYVAFMACYFSVCGFKDAIDLIKTLWKYSNLLGNIYCIVIIVLTIPAVPLAYLINLTIFIIESIVSIGFYRSFNYIKHKFNERRRARNAEISSSKKS